MVFSGSIDFKCFFFSIILAKYRKEPKTLGKEEENTTALSKELVKVESLSTRYATKRRNSHFTSNPSTYRHKNYQTLE